MSDIRHMSLIRSLGQSPGSFYKHQTPPELERIANECTGGRFV
jgi:hypothetical protein